MVTQARFEQGLTLEQYVAQMTVNKERFIRALGQAVLPPGATRVLACPGDPTRVLVITEDWCGTSLAYIPLVVKLAEHGGLDLRIFLRDTNADLMDQYLNRGLFRSIPVFVFFDGDMKEVARFIERPPKITEYMEQKQLELRRQLRAQHGSEWQRSAAEEIRALLG